MIQNFETYSNWMKNLVRKFTIYFEWFFWMTRLKVKLQFFIVKGSLNCLPTFDGHWFCICFQSLKLFTLLIFPITYYYSVAWTDWSKLPKWWIPAPRNSLFWDYACLCRPTRRLQQFDSFHRIQLARPPNCTTNSEGRSLRRWD